MSDSIGSNPVSLGGARNFQMNSDAQQSFYADVENFNQQMQAAAAGNRPMQPGSDAANAAEVLLRDGERLVQDYFGSNNAGLSPWAKKVIDAMDYQINQALSDMLTGNDPTRKLAAFGRTLETAFAPQGTPTPASVAQPAAGTIAAGNGGVDVANASVQSLLDRERMATTTGEKSDLLSGAIATLLQQLQGANGGAGSVGINGGVPTPAGLLPPPAGVPGTALTNDVKLSGGDLAAQTESGDGTAISKDADGAIGSANGYHGEIDGKHPVVFHVPPGKQAAGAEVDLSAFYDHENGHREQGTIKAYKDGKLVETVRVGGTDSGKQSVTIDKPFDTLVFEADNDKDKGVSGAINRAFGRGFDGSDYRVASITLKEQAPVAGGTTDGSLPGLGLARDATKVLGELNQLARSVNAPPQVIDQIANLARQIGSAVSQSGGIFHFPRLTDADLTRLLQGLGSVVDQVRPGLTDTAQGRATMDDVSALVGRIARTLDRPDIFDVDIFDVIAM